MANRPNKYSESERKELSDAVLNGMRSGLSALKSCQAAGITQSMFNRWLLNDEVLATEYAHAREDLIELMANDILEIADSPIGVTDSGMSDSGAVADKRLRVDTRKWLLSKLAPKKYGDLVGQEQPSKLPQLVIHVSDAPAICDIPES